MPLRIECLGLRRLGLGAGSEFMSSLPLPAVTLRSMTEAEFGPWRDIAIDQHGAQVSRATGKSLAAAVEESRVLLSKVLPEGLQTDGMRLFAITDGEARIGWLWLGASPSDPAAGFVFDIMIDADARGRGYGRATMLAAEQLFRSQGKTRVALTVAGGNDTARGLYESLGYLPTSTSMAKNLEG